MRKKLVSTIIILLICVCGAYTYSIIQSDYQRFEEQVTYCYYNRGYLSRPPRVIFQKYYDLESIIKNLNQIRSDENNKWVAHANEEINASRLTINTQRITKEEYFEITSEMNDMSDIYETKELEYPIYRLDATRFSPRQFQLIHTKYGTFATNKLVVASHTPYYVIRLEKTEVSTDYEDVKSITDWIALGNGYQIGWHDKYGMVMYESNAIGQDFSGTMEEIKKQMKESNYSEEEIVYKQQWCDDYLYLINTRGAFVYNECMQANKEMYYVRAERPPTYIVYKITTIKGEDIRFE